MDTDREVTYGDFAGEGTHARKRDLDFVADAYRAICREDLDALDGALHPFVVFGEVGELDMTS